MKRKHKRYDRPKKAYDGVRIKSEDKLVIKYGLKNKKEIWKAEARVKYFRNRAKGLITAQRDIQKTFFNKLNDVGLNVNSISDVLALGKEDILKRRLATIVFSRGLATTPKQARQMIVHKKIWINKIAVNIPSYLVKVNEEKNIELKVKKKVKKKKPKDDEVNNE